MKKIAIFNVGGALSSYLEFDDKKMVIDLGASSDFSPVNDFLIPLAEKRLFPKNASTGKYEIDQLFISHLDRDHISDYEKFKNKFHPDWMTCPNDNDKEGWDGAKQQNHFKVNVDMLGVENDTRNLILEDMRARQPLTSDAPLAAKYENIKLFFIKPKECEENEKLSICYANNISLVLLIQVGEKNLLMPGDILKEGMRHLLENNSELKDELNNRGLDFLIAPHHGLQTSFPDALFQETKGNRTRLNIISEKLREGYSNENRSEVDCRYYKCEYSSGENTLKQNAIKTSRGHIIIDFNTNESEVRIIDNSEDLLREFI